MELNAALHRAIGIGAATVTTWLTTRLQRVRARGRNRFPGPPADRGRPHRRRLDRQELSAILGELIEDTDPPVGFIPALAQLATTATKPAEQSEPTATATPPAPCTKPPACSPTTLGSA